jgi:uroporphyrinogen-III decarboxylase
MHGPPEAIQAAVNQCYGAAGQPFMVAAGCEIPAATPPAHLHALCAPIRP